MGTALNSSRRNPFRNSSEDFEIVQPLDTGVFSGPKCFLRNYIFRVCYSLDNSSGIPKVRCLIFFFFLWRLRWGNGVQGQSQLWNLWEREKEARQEGEPPDEEWNLSPGRMRFTHTSHQEACGTLFLHILMTSASLKYRSPCPDCGNSRWALSDWAPCCSSRRVWVFRQITSPLQTCSPPST